MVKTLNGLRTEIPQPYLDYMLMKEMNWSYTDLLNTPVKVIEAIWKILELQAEHRDAFMQNSSTKKNNGNKQENS